jgi:hypothetical protein
MKPARELIIKLIERSWLRRYLSSSRYTAHDYVAMGKEIPDHLLPGRMITELSTEERETLVGLTSADTQDRQ